MAKQRAIELHLDNTFTEKRFNVDKNKIKPAKNEETRFAPSNVFTERKTWNRLKFWKHRRRLIFFVEGTVEALKFGKVTKTMNPFWTMGETKDFVWKNIMKALTEHKPMKWSQFIIILIPVLISLGLLARIAMVLGAI